MCTHKPTSRRRKRKKEKIQLKKVKEFFPGDQIMCVPEFIRISISRRVPSQSSENQNNMLSFLGVQDANVLDNIPGYKLGYGKHRPRKLLTYVSFLGDDGFEIYHSGIRLTKILTAELGIVYVYIDADYVISK